jgi:hypothetical protein
MDYKHIVFILFSLAIILLLFINFNSKSKSVLIENLENQTQTQSNCCGNDPLFLAMKNASDIVILKDQVKEIGELKQKLNVIETNTQNNTKYIEDLQQQYANEASNVQNSLTTSEEDNAESEPNDIL